jgi:hypothetical protein
MTILVPQILTYGSATTNGGASTTTPHTRTFGSLPANGDSVIISLAMVDNFAPGAVSAVTDNQGTGNVYSLLYAQNDGSSGDLGRMEMWGCPAVTVSTGPFTLSAAYTGTYVVQSALLEASGLANSNFLDQANGNGFTSITTLTLTNGSANSNANDLVLATLLLADYATNAPNSPANTGYSVWGTGIGSDGGRETQASYKIVTSIETSQATWTWTGAEQGAAIIVTLKGAAVAPSQIIMGQACL